MLDGLRAFYGDAIAGNADYAKIMECGARLIEACGQRTVDPDGWLGIVKVLRQTFEFLASEFGLECGPEPEDAFEYASDRVKVSLDVPGQTHSGCRIKQASDEGLGFFLEDLLFMDGRTGSLALPPGHEFRSEADVRAWFSTVADILRQHGSDVLADRPGAFERLAQASAERDRLIGEECERLYGTGGSGTG